MALTINYPQELKGLLKKAGLLGTGKVVVKAVETSITREIAADSDGDSLVFEKRVDVLDDIQMNTKTTPVKTNAGLIAGYWANGLSSIEKKLINEEANVPFFYLEDGDYDTSGRFLGHKDTVFHLFDGKEYDLSIPAHVAEWRCLLESTAIGHDLKDAKDIDADFFFYSKEEDTRKKVVNNSKRKEAVKLVDELSVEEKFNLVRIMHYQGSISINPYLSKGDAVLMFDELAFVEPLGVMRAQDQTMKYQFILAHALIAAGVIETGGIDGPYYKSPMFAGSRTLIADNMAKLLKSIEAEADLVAQFKQLEKASLDEQGAGENIYTKDTIDLYRKHGLVQDESDEETENPLMPIIAKATKNKLFKLLEDSNVKHEFTHEDDIKDIRDYTIENIINGN